MSGARRELTLVKVCRGEKKVYLINRRCCINGGETSLSKKVGKVMPFGLDSGPAASFPVPCLSVIGLIIILLVAKEKSVSVQVFRFIIREAVVKLVLLPLWHIIILVLILVLCLQP